MQVYTNRFVIAKNQDGSEIILNCFQNLPKLEVTAPEDDQADLPTETVAVASLVMTRQSAHNLMLALQGLLE